jgi:hypothetical protein
MDQMLRRMLGLEGARTAIYRFAEGEVSKEDFEYARVIDQVIFDKEIGYIATLGPTWNMVHDPRFLKIENTFVIERTGRLIDGHSGQRGNANVGQGIISEDGLSGGNPNDLERYSDMLGDGRVMLKAVKEAGIDPQTFHNNDGFIWTIIKANWPNYFRQAGLTATPEALLKDITTPKKFGGFKLVNDAGGRLYDMAKAGLAGLIDDYAEVPLSDEWVDAESGELLTPETHNDPDVMGVYLEIDQLDKAISARTQLRLLAARILKQLGLASKIKSGCGRLTDMERDEILRIVYSSKWPDEKPQLVANLLAFISNTTKRPFEQREKEQLQRASQASKEMIAKIKSGEINQINRTTDPGKDWGAESTTAGLDSIMKDPLRRHLFPIYTAAERAKNTPVVELLAPVFNDPNFVLNDEVYIEIGKKLEALSKPLPTKTVEEYF